MTIYYEGGFEDAPTRKVPVEDKSYVPQGRKPDRVVRVNDTYTSNLYSPTDGVIELEDSPGRGRTMLHSRC